MQAFPLHHRKPANNHSPITAPVQLIREDIRPKSLDIIQATNTAEISPVELKEYAKKLNLIDVSIFGPNDKHYNLLLATDMDGHNIKMLINRKWGYPIELQHLNIMDVNGTVNNMEINNEDTLKSLLEETGGKDQIKLKLSIKYEEEYEEESE